MFRMSATSDVAHDLHLMLVPFPERKQYMKASISTSKGEGVGLGISHGLASAPPLATLLGQLVLGVIEEPQNAASW